MLLGVGVGEGSNLAELVTVLAANERRMDIERTRKNTRRKLSRIESDLARHLTIRLCLVEAIKELAVKFGFALR